jgi:hypothetical protein
LRYARVVGRAALNSTIVLLALYFGLAIFYWLGWPIWLRQVGAVLFPVAIGLLWFFPIQRVWPIQKVWPKFGPLRRPASRLLAQRGVAALLLGALATAYMTKTPVEQDWVPLMGRHATATIDGNIVTIANFRDAVHRTGQPSIPVWTTARFDLSQLDGADLVIQPFGTSKATAHILLSFRFADGRHVVVSMESRQAQGKSFDAIAGFFRHDQLYPELATERDLFWERLSRTPPDNLQIYPIRQSPETLRAYFRRILIFANDISTRPKFYSTLDESCMTAFINLEPESFASVPVYDVRRWIPGYSLSLFQQLGLVDNNLPAAQLERLRTLRPGLRPPSEFPSDAAWSAYLRSGQ